LAKKILLFSLMVLILFSGLGQFAFPQETAITRSDRMNDVIFDGKWTFYEEWKVSALETIITENDPIYIRTAHQDNFIYVMLAVTADRTPNFEDYSIVCFDTTISNSSEISKGIYCFKVNVGSDKPITLGWDKKSQSFLQIENHEELVSVGGASDENGYYKKYPHTSFEFKIPLNLLQRYDRYGFFVGVYDSAKPASYTWPDEINLDPSSNLPPPKSWGELVSPDKSLPEYDWPILALVITVSVMILFTSKRTKLGFQSTIRQS